jgi:D-glycero-alpha-D-manno-heptose-7-phosphate kinase
MNKTVRSKAPLRLGLAGGGTDVSPFSDLYGGAILNVTIDMYTYTTLQPIDEKKIIFESLDQNIVMEYDLAPELPVDGKLDLHKGVYNRIIRDFCGGVPFPIRMITYSDAPAGSGLGSSSALMVAMIAAMKEYLNLPLGDYELAHLAYEIERIDLNMAGGKQDQYSATFGGFNFMEFFNGDKVIVNPLRIKPNITNELEFNMMLYYTGKSRVSSDIIKNQVSNVTSKEGKSIDAMKNLKEQAVQMKNALLRGELDQIGKILNYGWENKKNMAKDISNTTIDRIMEKALEYGAIGGKISGAGGGGYIMLYVEGLKRARIREGLKEFGGSFMDFSFSLTGVQTWTL